MIYFLIAMDELRTWLQSERGQANVPQWVWFLIVCVAVFAVVVLIGGSCTIGDRSIGTN